MLSEEYLIRDRPLHIVVGFFHLLGCSILGFCIAKRTPQEWSEWRNMGWGRMCMILLLVDSWIFIFVSGVMTTGVLIFQDPVACSATGIICVVFQGSSKALIYSYLIEKVYIVWSDGCRIPRLRTRTYRICLLSLLGYVAIYILFLYGGSSRIREDGTCLLQYAKYATISLIVYDFLQSIFLTVMFCWPLYKSKLMSPSLRGVAKKTFIGSMASLVVLVINTSLVVIMGGYQVVWVCMTSCPLDATIHALIMYWVSSGISSDSIDHFTLPTIDTVTRQDFNVDDLKSKCTVTAGDLSFGTLTTMASLRTTDLISTERFGELATVEKQTRTKDGAEV